MTCGYFCVYFNQQTHLLARGRYARIPIQWIGDNALVEVQVEGKKFLVKLDLGASCQFAFFSEALESIRGKKFIEFITTTDVKGNQYKEKSYSVPLITAKNFSYKNANISEESKDFALKGAVLWQSKSKTVPYVGRMGRNSLIGNNLFLDFPNSMMFITSGLDQLQTDYWSIGDLIETSFEMSRWGIILCIETDIGVKKLILDTGASGTVLKQSNSEVFATKEVVPGKRIYTTKKFAIGGRDFGPRDLAVFEMVASFDADGYLGLDFLKNYAIYLDFKNNKALIGPSSKTCGAIVF
jgi:hypothetical protein